MCIADGKATSPLPSNSELQEIIKKMYEDNGDNLKEITTIEISKQVSIGMPCIYITVLWGTNFSRMTHFKDFHKNFSRIIMQFFTSIE